MPKPEWVQKRNNLKQTLRLTEQLADDDKFLDAFDEIETSDDAAARAARDPGGYFKGKGVTIPQGLEIKEVTRSSPGSVTVVFDFIFVRITW